MFTLYGRSKTNVTKLNVYYDSILIKGLKVKSASCRTGARGVDCFLKFVCQIQTVLLFLISSYRPPVDFDSIFGCSLHLALKVLTPHALVDL